MTRYFVALYKARARDMVLSSCHQCASLRSFPQSSEEPPDSLGLWFAADVIKQYWQLIFVLRVYVSTYTVTLLIPGEQRKTLREAILMTCLPIRSIRGSPTIIRTDSAPGFKSLKNDEFLHSHHSFMQEANFLKQFYQNMKINQVEINLYADKALSKYERW